VGAALVGATDVGFFVDFFLAAASTASAPSAARSARARSRRMTPDCAGSCPLRVGNARRLLVRPFALVPTAGSRPHVPVRALLPAAWATYVRTVFKDYFKYLVIAT